MENTLDEFINKIVNINIYDEINFTFGEIDSYTIYYGIKKINIFDGEIILIGKWGSVYYGETAIINNKDKKTIKNSLWDYMNYEGIPNYDRETITIISD